MSGFKDNFPGLIPMVKLYVASINIDIETRAVVDNYIELVSKRASGRAYALRTWVGVQYSSYISIQASS